MDKQFWDVLNDLITKHGYITHNYQVDGYDDHPIYSLRIYTNPYCFDITKEFICNPDEVDEYNIEGLQNDGYIYSFTEPFDGFEKMGVENAIKLILTFINN